MAEAVICWHIGLPNRVWRHSTAHNTMWSSDSLHPCPDNWIFNLRSWNETLVWLRKTHLHTSLLFQLMFMFWWPCVCVTSTVTNKLVALLCVCTRHVNITIWKLQPVYCSFQNTPPSCYCLSVCSTCNRSYTMLCGAGISVHTHASLSRSSKSAFLFFFFSFFFFTVLPLDTGFKVCCYELDYDMRCRFDPPVRGIFGQCMGSVPTQYHEDFR